MTLRCAGFKAADEEWSSRGFINTTPRCWTSQQTGVLRRCCSAICSVVSRP